MKIFFSWSKPLSNDVSVLIKELILNIFDDDNNKPDFFISGDDIYAGEQWFSRIAEGLRSCDLAIITLTTENKHSKWLDFESGAIAFNGNNANVCPFLVDFNKLEDGNPLKNFQVTKNNKNDMLRLIKTIRNRGGYPLSNRQLDSIFAKEYKEFKKKIDKTLRNRKREVDTSRVYSYLYPPDITVMIPNTVFIGTPMASVDSETYEENWEKQSQIIQSLNVHTSFDRVYSPITDIPKSDHFDGKEEAVEIDFAEIKRSEYFILIYPQKSASSVLMEVGYAIALMKKVVIFVRNRRDLPFMLERADKRNRNIKIYDFKDYDDLLLQIRNDSKFIFEFKFDLQ